MEYRGDASGQLRLDATLLNVSGLFNADPAAQVHQLYVYMSLPEQAAAIAVRGTGENFEVCLIRRKGSKAWGIPKGLVDPGDTHAETALNEAWEEAGLTGRVIGEAIGTYQYEKWETTLTVAVYLVEVLEQHDAWQEAGFRERRWTSFSDAASLLMDHPVRPLLDRARRFL